jgi:serine phosphatase RsbU (regulator of sigma subunit)
MRLVVLQEGAMVADVVCGGEAIYVGSGPDCRVRLEDPLIAPQQAVIYPEGDGGWTVQSLDPSAEVFVNRTRLGEKATLKTGDEIGIRDFLVRVYPEFEEQPGARVEVGTSRAQLERFAASKLPPGTIIKRADEPLAVQPGQLVRIAEANLAVSQCQIVEALMDVALRTLLVNFAVPRVWMGVRRVNYGPMDYVEGRLLTGQPTDLPEVANALKPRVLDRAQYLLVPAVSPEERMSVLAGPLIGPEATLGMMYMDTGTSGRRFGVPDLDYFILLSTVFAVQLDAIFKQIARNRAAMVEGEVAVAHAIQARLTPRKLPQWEQLQLGAFREPGRKNTGDIYDVVKLSSGRAALMVAHTSATGAMPSLLMAAAQTAFRLAAMHQDAPHAFLRSLNWLLCDGEKDHPLNCFMAVIDPATGETRYSLAGQTGAYIIGNRGEERRLGTLELTPPLGLTRTVAYPVLPEQLEPDETLVVFTPGVTTAKNPNDETFGEARFVNILCDGFGQLASSMLKEMLTDLRTFTERGSQPDDITVLLAHRVSG